METFEHFWTFTKYPIGTAFHWLQGALVGWLFYHAHAHASVVRAILALTLSMIFLNYEETEFLRINDDGDKDIANFLYALYLSWIVCNIVERFRQGSHNHALH